MKLIQLFKGVSACRTFTETKLFEKLDFRK